nr:MAG TPA: hypothetical protein [Caudoviricetes sp.]
MLLIDKLFILPLDFSPYQSDRCDERKEAAG